MQKKLMSLWHDNLYFDYIIIMLISLHTVVWFNNGMLYFQGDTGLPYNPIKNLNMLYMWWERQAGYESWALSQAFIFIFFALLEKLGVGLIASQDLYIYLGRAIAGLGMYYLASNFTNNRLVRLWAAFIYLFCPFSLGLVWIYVYLPFVLIPLIFGLYIKGLNSNSKSHILLAAIFLVFLTADFPNYRQYLISVLLIVLYSAFYVLTDSRGLKNSLKYSFKLFVLFGIISQLLLLWIFMPILWIMMNAGASKMLSNIGISFGDYGWATLPNVIRLRGSATIECGGGAVYAQSLLNNPILIISSFYLTFVVFSLLFSRKKLNPSIYFLFIIGILFLFLSKGTNPPLGDVYSWVVIHVPLARAFRTSWLSIIPVAIVYSILGALSINLIYNRLLNNKKIYGYSFIGFSIFIILVSSYPLVTGSYIQSVFSPTKSGGYMIPDSYYKMADYLSEHKNDGRLLKIPASDGYMNTVHSWNYWGSDIIPFIFSENSYIDGYHLVNSAGPLLKYLFKKIEQKNFDAKFDNMLKIFNVKYILIDGYEENYRFDIQAANYRMELPKNNRIILEKKFDRLCLYRFDGRDAAPHIYPARSIFWVE